MTLETVKKDLEYLTEEITSPPERLLLLRPSLELSLLKLGHDQKLINEALDDYYRRTLH